MAAIRTLAVLLLAVTFAFGQPTLTVGPTVGYTHYSQSLGFSPSVTIGAVASIKATESLGFSLEGQFGSTEKQFDAIGGMNEIDVSISRITARLDFNPLSFGSWHILLSPGGGFITMKTDEMQVSLGPLGTTTVPGQSDTHALASVAAGVHKPISDMFSFTVQPGVDWIFQDGDTHSMFTVTGGVRIAIL